MFGFLKQKRDAEEFGKSFAGFVTKFALGASSEKVDEQIAGMISKGASVERIRPELAAFLCFCRWAGMASALQKGKIKERDFEVFYGAYLEELEVLSSTIDVTASGSLSYSTFWEWLQARLDRYIEITNLHADGREAIRQVIDNFCDFACKGEPTEGLKFELQHTYLMVSGNMYDILAGTRFV